jgi:hypothetical protein
VALFGRPYLFVHAGVVGWQNRAIVIPGRSMDGKSTLVAALVELGAVYFSDEYAVLDRRGRIHQYRKPVALRIQDGSVSRASFVPPTNTDGAQKPLVAGVVAFLKYKVDAGWSPLKMSPGEAVLSLFDNTVLAQKRAKFALRVLSTLVEHAEAVRTLRPDVSLAAPALLDLASKAKARE